MIVVSDTSPIFALAHLDLLGVLAQLYGEVLLPPAVVRELAHPRPPARVVLPESYPFFRVQSPTDAALVQRLAQDLDPGESEAIALAVELRAHELLIDERHGRSVAAAHGLKTTGVLAVLLEAKRQGLVRALRPLIDGLERGLDFRISAQLKAQVLQLAGEPAAL